MLVRLLDGVRVAGPHGNYGPGETVEVTAAQGERMIALGRAVEVVIASPVTGPEKAAEVALPEGDDFTQIPTLNAEIACLLRQYGHRTFADLDAAADADLLKLAGIGPGRLAKMREYLAARVERATQAIPETATAPAQGAQGRGAQGSRSKSSKNRF